jgi:hypothetical protein
MIIERWEHKIKAGRSEEAIDFVNCYYLSPMHDQKACDMRLISNIFSKLRFWQVRCKNGRLVWT